MEQHQSTEPAGSAKPKAKTEERDPVVRMELEKQSLADEAYDEFVKSGGPQSLPGFGKPLVIPTGDILDSILRKANVDPPWVMLKKEIGANMEKIIAWLQKSPNHPEIDSLLSDTNKQIIELNGLSPSHLLHRQLIGRSNIEEQYQRWYGK